MTQRKKLPLSEERQKNAYDETLERSTNVKHTSNIGKTQVERFTQYKETEMKNYGIRLAATDKRKFEAYWKKRGMTFSQGIRTVIKDFMERQGI